MNELKVFESPDFGKIRTVTIEGEPWLVGKDVAEALGYSNPRDALSCHVDAEDKGVVKCDTLGGIQNMTIINESGLYGLIMSSKLPSAKSFKHWVTSEVLPSIRKTGGYSMQAKLPASYAEALRELADTVEQKERLALENAELKPKAEFYDTVTGSKDAIDMGSVAKVLNMGIGLNKLFQILRGRKILQPNNRPYQTYIDRGYFRCIESSYTKPNGDTCVNIKTVVYQKGVDFIRKIVKKA